MPKVSEVCRQVRSKAAGPFWVTIDLFFDGANNFARFSQSPALGAERIGAIYGVKPEFVKHYAVPSLAMIKISYPRPTPQGWIVERDLHSGQQYVRLLDLEL